MKLADKLTNFNTIKKAIEIEIKNNYINIDGKTQSFAKFIAGEVKKIVKLFPKETKWKKLLKKLEYYHMDNVSERINNLNELIILLHTPIDEDDTIKNNLYSTDPDEIPVMYAKGIGPKVAKILNRVNIFTISDLINYYPKRYLDYTQRTKISQIENNEQVTIFGTIKSVSMFNSKNKNLSILKILVTDGSGTLSATWFYAKANRSMQERYKAQYPKGANIILSGIAKHDKFSNLFAIDRAEATIISGDFDEKDIIHNARIVPIYPLCENLNAKTLRKAIFNCLEQYSDKIKTVLPQSILEKLNLFDKKTAINQIHFPSDFDTLEQARTTLIFEELFIQQLKFMLIREETKRLKNTLVINIKEGGLVDKFVKSLPFTLTEAQNKAFNEILSDLNSTEPMQRLLQGDVGSGKTVVACMMLLAIVENGYQGAIMAPTEILAEQHYKNFINWLTPLGVSLGLFVGRHGIKTRRETQTNLKNSQTDIAIGTHALIQTGVEFANLGGIVIDEQHRFGVRQRKELSQKGLNPQMLTMTATPIPRTLALSVHGDLDLTIIDELPAGRKPVKTSLIKASQRTKTYGLIREEIEKGNKAYIVFPLIDESETLSAKAATKEAKRLAEKVFPDLKIGLVHGKQKPQEKEENMLKFKNGEYHILVSTTVIEVGVDIPDATVMMIENSERFGLSQLHQLRGRVGRSDKQSYCILVSDTNTSETKERLNVLVQTNDGFVIAEKDLQIRGPGEFLGTRQSGLPDLLIADIVRDTKILEMAREEAINFLKTDNLLKYSNLNKIIQKQIEDMKSFINAG
ncbi:MAG: ATP-dependent DNA helicase RecG [Candidatus Gastranaerophilales bacterium]|nr:ATP-dependent DNA helicase RecG [Candidatus Gastranaerophilales bacterium]